MDPKTEGLSITNTLIIQSKDVNQTSPKLFPIRCHNCGHVLSGLEGDVIDMLEDDHNYDYETIFEKLKIGKNRGCCRSSILNPQQIVMGKYHGVEFPESFKEPFSFIQSDDRAKHSRTLIRKRTRKQKGRNFLNIDFRTTKKITTKAGTSLSNEISNIIPAISKQLESDNKTIESKTGTRVFPGVNLES